MAQRKTCTNGQAKRKRRIFGSLNGSPRETRVGTFDIETNGFDGEILGIGCFTARKRFFFFKTPEEFLRFCHQKRNRNTTWYAHNGGKFDFLHLFRPMLKLRMFPKIIAQGSRIAELSLRQGKKKHKKQISFRDSISLLGPFSLEKLTKQFQVTQKMTGTIDFEGGEKFNHKNKLHMDYLKADCVSLYEIIEKFRDSPIMHGCELKLTAASQSMDVFRRKFLTENFVTTKQDLQDYVRKGYFGGRVEVFRQHGKNLFCYDINSLYPAMMLKELPLDFLKDSLEPLHGNGFFEISFYCPDMYVPILPMKSKEGKLIFPCGYIRGIYHTSEIIEAVRFGYKILKVHKGKLFRSSETFFKSYVTTLYNERKKHDSSTSMNFICKLFMNSLYGKFGQREDRTEITFSPKTPLAEPWGDEKTFREFNLFVEKTFKRSNFMQVNIAAAITANARATLFQYLIENENYLYYCDTDSVFLSREITPSTDLGKMKLEKSGFEGKFRGPKNYALRDSKQVKFKVKGMDTRYLNTDFDHFLQDDFSYSKKQLMSFKESIKRFQNPVKMIERTRKLNSTYDKRIVLSSGNTRPLYIDKNGEIK